MIKTLVTKRYPSKQLNGYATLAGSDNKDLPPDVESLFSTLETQMKTLQNRLRVLDPLSTSGRNRKETFDLLQRNLSCLIFDVRGLNLFVMPVQLGARRGDGKLPLDLDRFLCPLFDKA